MRVLTYLLVVVGWVPFRSDNFTMAATWLNRMFVPQSGLAAPSALIAWVIAALLIIATVPETWHLPIPTRRVLAFACGVALFFCCLFINDGKSVFLYYQF